MTLSAPAERLIESFRQRTACCAVVGLGYIGTTQADALLAAGFETHGVDRLSDAADRCRKHLAAQHPAPARPWSIGIEPAVIAHADVVIVAVRAAFSSSTGIEWEPMRAAMRIIREYPKEPRLIIIETTLPPGKTRHIAQDLLGWMPQSSTFIAHSPERLSAGHDRHMLMRTAHLVGGIDAESTRVASAFLSELCERVVSVSSPEVSELSKLLENAFLSVGIGLVNEITHIAHALGISAVEVCNAAATKPFGYFPFLPGPGVGGHCLPNDLRMLADTGQALCGEGALLAAADRLNTFAPAMVVRRLGDMLACPINGKRVLVIGVGFKIRSADTSATPARDVIRALRAEGALPSYCDSQVPSFEVDGCPVERVEPGQIAHTTFAAAIILSGDPQLSASLLDEFIPFVLDTGGGHILSGASVPNRWATL